MKHMLTLTLALSLMASLTACNIVRGAGQDLKGAGEWIVDGVSNAERKTQPAPPSAKYQYPGEDKASHRDY
jgi:predicted small secreted protein